MNGLAKTVSLDSIFCKLLQLALGHALDFSFSLTEKEWRALLYMAMEQTLLGVTYQGVLKLPKEAQPPRAVAIQWSAAAETIRGSNELMNQKAAYYSKLFADRGVPCAVLKGQANARLYPMPLSRQTGDIDIWVAGGYDKVVLLLDEMGLISKDDYFRKNSYHIEFNSSNNIEVEVHYKPVSGIPFRSKKFQKILEREIENVTLVPEGFYVPSIRFALLMQLAHLQQHFFAGGLGLRHFTDYYMLLKHSTQADRDFVWSVIKCFKLNHACAATMGLLEKVFELPREYMLCPPDKKRGLRLYQLAMTGGNFGQYDPKHKDGFVFRRWLNDRKRMLHWFSFDPLNDHH